LALRLPAALEGPDDPVEPDGATELARSVCGMRRAGSGVSARNALIVRNVPAIEVGFRGFGQRR
jgi:hypothetical protein